MRVNEKDNGVGPSQHTVNNHKGHWLTAFYTAILIFL